MAWEKRGFIFKPNGEAPWMRSHAQGPTALLLEDRIRVYITVRPQQDQSRATFIDLDIKDPSKIIQLHKEPLLELGKNGAFDQFGIMPSHAMHVDDEVWLYYVGWNRGHEIPHYINTGLAVSKDGGTSFTKKFVGPVLAVNRYHPYSIVSPHILRHDGTWHLWHGATTRWEEINGKYELTYNIFHATSNDGIDWKISDTPCIPGDTETQCTVRPSVIFKDGLFQMWFSYRENHNYHEGDGGYRIGYASSKDGANWQRDDSKVGIGLSKEGWDSKMIAYPNIIDTKHGLYMFYNGNDFGISGFGYAVWKD